MLTGTAAWLTCSPFRSYPKRLLRLQHQQQSHEPLNALLDIFSQPKQHFKKILKIR